MANNGKILPLDLNVTARKLQTTMPMILPEVQDNCMRNYMMLALAESRGQVIFNCFGLGMTWKVKYRNHKVQGTNGENPRSYGQTNQHQTARLDWRGYEVAESIFKHEIRLNKGEAAVINVFENFEEGMKTSLRQEMGLQFYNDGYDTTNPDYWHGLMSCYRQAGETLGPSNTPRARNDADKIIVPQGEFADIDVALGAFSGEQHNNAVNWPEGTADVHYDFWSPLMLQWDGTGFGSGTDGLKYMNALRYGLTHAQRNNDKNGAITHSWTDRTNFIGLKTEYATKQTIEATAGTELGQLGFKDILIFDGVEVAAEHAMPAGFGFGVNMENIELRCLDEQLFVMDGPEYDMDLKCIKAAVETHSNIVQRSARNMVILAPKSAVAA